VNSGTGGSGFHNEAATAREMPRERAGYARRGLRNVVAWSSWVEED
jgi:hypothetical protein